MERGAKERWRRASEERGIKKEREVKKAKCDTLLFDMVRNHYLITKTICLRTRTELLRTTGHQTRSILHSINWLNEVKK